MPMHRKFDHWFNEPDLSQLKNSVRLRQREPVEALKQWRALAERGSVMSMIYIGHAYQEGSGTAKDLAQTEEWYRKAADAGSALASYLLGRLYLKQKQFEEAKDAFRFGAAAGYAPATSYLGRMYYLGLGVERDWGKAKHYLEEASAQGNIMATRVLGQMLIRARRTTMELLRGILLTMRAFIDVFVALFREGAESDRYN